MPRVALREDILCHFSATTSLYKRVAQGVMYAWTRPRASGAMSKGACGNPGTADIESSWN